ncbi:protein-serine O-palmitoleoyltransferase porcupine [Drosophila innubila]|uniref:protein-serine O-palmitoleoyltransferase porcupine n=1 Tax=Drosophila innubila TaxID=198719 RepID=UPI00148DE63E|nr:protein-serine O-palmitoleoyltransferase porcupine [Drosophila innubila]
MDYQYYDEPDYIDDDGGSEDIYPDHESSPDHRYYHNGNAYENDNSLMDRLGDSYANCILPSLGQVLSYLLPLLAGCLLSRLLTALYATTRQQQRRVLSPLHLINALCGLGMLYATLGERILLLLLLSGISYLLLQLVRLSPGLGKGQRGAVTIAVLCIGSQFIYELAIWQQREDWPQLRGLQMVSNMKVISLAFDMTATGTPGSSELRMPSILAYLGYIYNPASCVLGPWLSYSRYLDSLCHKPHWRRSLLQMLCNVLLCLLALSVSNCIAPALGELHLQDQDEVEATRRGGVSHWLLMYTGALSVRSSHYFVSFLSQALLAAAGQRLDSTQHASSQLLGDLVSRPWHIEWPHSLSALVRCWNVPMHEWLKRYVYAASKQRSRHNTIVAVFCTYIVSSLLHGMDLRIYLVLLSLATFAEGETMLRRHLATLSNACVAANPCPGAERCRYTHCPRQRGWRCFSSWLVAFTNVAFTLLAIFHLAYLGIVLLNETLTVETDHEMPFMFHWAAAGYLSHYIGIGMFMLYLFIS